LATQLVSADKSQRSQAAEQLGRYGNAAKIAAPLLAKVMREDADANVAHTAAVALARLGRPSVKHLIEALDDESAAVRQRAVAALALIGPDARPATPALIKLLKNDEAVIRSAAAYALGEIGGDPEQLPAALCQALADPAADVQRQAGLALVNLGEEAVPALRELLKSKEASRRRDASQLLAAIGPDARDAAGDLALLLKDNDVQIRAAGAAALGSLGKEAQDAMPTLLELLRTEKNYEMQIQTFQTITLVGSKDPPSLQKALKEINDTTRWATPFVLRQFGPKPKAAVPHLIKALGDKEAGTRLAATLALGEIGDEARVSASALAKVLQDPSPNVRVAAAAALASVDPKQDALAKQHFALALANAQKAMILAQAQFQKQAAQLKKLVAAGGLVRPINRQALSDPMIQGFYSQVIDQKIMLSAYRPVSKTHFRDLKEFEITRLTTEVDRVINYDFGPEAIPALVRGINLAAIYNLGFC
jgi:HEAT repeat protein